MNTQNTTAPEGGTETIGNMTRRCKRCRSEWTKEMPRMPLEEFTAELKTNCPFCDAKAESIVIVGGPKTDLKLEVEANAIKHGFKPHTPDLPPSALEFMEHTPAQDPATTALEKAFAFCEAVEEIGEPDSTVIPVWPNWEYLHHPRPEQLTAGMVKIFHNALLFRRHCEIGGRRYMKNDYQFRVQQWMQLCFGPEVSADTVERNHRFLEEALELVQALGCTKDEAHSLVNYVYSRPAGEPPQEVGGVMVTLAALCHPNALNMQECGENELQRVHGKIEQIRAKQAGKPKHSPLPGPTAEETPPPRTGSTPMGV